MILTPPSLRWHAALAIFCASAAVLFALHPPSRVLWFDTYTIVENVRPGGPGHAIEFQREFHPKNYVRPVRATLWWGLVKVLGTSGRVHNAVNVLAMALVVTLASMVAQGIGARPWIVAAGLTLSYVTVYPAMYLGFALTACLGFLALVAYQRRWPVWSVAALLLLAALSHEAFLAFVVAVWAAELFLEPVPGRYMLAALGVVPAYLVLRLLHAHLFHTHGIAWGGWSIENPLRIVFAMLTGGVPLEPMRALGEPFMRVRELITNPVTAGLIIAYAGIGALLTWASHRAAPLLVTLFLWSWIAAGTLPLMLPVAPPEVFHLVGPLAALMMLWSFVPKRYAVALVALLTVNVGMTVQLTWVDLPKVEAVVRHLDTTQSFTLPHGNVGLPIMVGAHYAMLPSTSFTGCLDSPVWMWGDATVSAERLYNRGGVKRRACQ